MNNNKGQTFVEFCLVFLVLFAVGVGVIAMYKSYWKERYELTKTHSNAVGKKTVEMLGIHYTYVK